MTDINVSADAKSNLCAHCKEPIVPGDQVVAYIQPNAEKNGNVIEIMIHVRCAQAFIGSARLQ